MIKCAKCGKDVIDTAKFCPYCGSSVIADIPIADDNKRQTKKKPLIISIVAVVVIVAIVASAFAVSKFKAAKAREEYIDTLNEFAFSALSGAAKAEEHCNLIKSVWRDTIYKDDNPDTHKYTHKTNGEFFDDFNDSLTSVYVYTIDEQTEISDNQDATKELYQKLLSTPKDADLQSCFDLADELYDIYKKFTDMALSPSGSLTTFSEDFRNVDSDFMDTYDKLTMIIPEK